MSKTFTAYTTTECEHSYFKIKTARVRFWLFDLFMRYEVCQDCSQLMPTQKRWKIKFN